MIERIPGKHTGFVFQAFHLIDYLNVIDNIEVGLIYSASLSLHHVRERAEELVSRMNLEHCHYSYPCTLSSGKRQRVAIARALIRRPSFILTDEPSCNLDENTLAAVLDIFPSSIIKKQQFLWSPTILERHKTQIALSSSETGNLPGKDPESSTGGNFYWYPN